jgi:hypothetical protein
MKGWATRPNVGGLSEVHEQILMREPKHKQEIYPITRTFGFVVGICTAPLFIIFAYCGDPKRGSTAWFSAGIVLIVVRMFWGMRRRVLFWIVITTIAILHAVIIILVPWPFGQLSYVALLPVGFLDFAITYGIIRFVESAVDKGANGWGSSLGSR